MPPAPADGATPAGPALLNWLGRRVASLARPAPVRFLAATPIAEAAERLHQSGEPAGFVCDEAGRALGVVDATALLGALLAAPPAPDLAALAAEGPALLAAGATLPSALPAWHDDVGRPLGVIDAEGRPLGLLYPVQAFAPLLTPLGAWTGPEASDAAGRARLWRGLLEEGYSAVAVQAALAEAMDLLVAAHLERALAAMAADGWGAPPVDFAVLAMGSAGRRESFLAPDQDNGFILEDYPDAAHGPVDAFFIELAQRFTQALAAAGLPLCRGEVMATNPVWRKSLGQWRAQLAGWASRQSPQSVMWADIFLDFRAVAGRLDLGAALRAALLEVCAEQPQYLQRLTWEHVCQEMPLGLFGRLLGEPGAAHHHELDLKLRVRMPLVGLVRALALRTGIAATGTLERLAALRAAGRLSAGFAAELAEDFAALTELSVRLQLADLAAGRPAGHRLALDGLNERDRGRLVGVLRDIDTLRRVTAQEFGGRLG